jgi:hypothetical protein
MPLSAAAASVIGTIIAVASVAAKAATVAYTALTVYQAVQRPSVGSILAATTNVLKLPGDLAAYAAKMGIIDAVPAEIAASLDVSRAFSEVLGKDVTVAVNGLIQALQPFGQLDPRLHDILVPLVGLTNRSLPDITNVLALTLGKPRRKYKDVGLAEFTGLDEDVQPLGEVIDEGLKSTTMDIRTLVRERDEEAQKERERDLVRRDQILQDLGFGSEADRKQWADTVRFFIEGVGKGPDQWKENLSAAITNGMLPVFEGVVGSIGPVISALINVIAVTVERGAEIAVEPIQRGLTGPLEKFFDTYRRNIQVSDAIRPEDTSTLAVAQFGEAMRFGVTAHMVALLCELCHPLKHLGLPQLAAGMVDAAAFGPIIGATIGTRIRVGLGRASELDARRTFRTTWPDIRTCEQMFLEGAMTRDAYAERLRYEGWPEHYIEMYLAMGEDEALAVPYREPNARELGILFEDVDVTEDWVLNMLRQQGYYIKDAEQILNGVQLRATKSFRQGLISELLSAYEDGLLYEQDFRDRLAPLHLREQTIRLLLDRSNLGLAHKQATRMAAVHRTLVENDVIPLDQYRVSLRALGYIDSQVEIEASLVDAKRRGKLLKDELRQEEAAFRKLQEETVRMYEERIRRGLSTPEEYQQVLLQLGFEDQLASATAELARVRQKPVLQLPTAMTPEAQAQRVRELLQKEILVRVTAKTIDPGLAGLNLLAMGLTKEEAEAQVRLAMARIPPEPAAGEKPEDTPEQREARRIRTNEAITRYAAGELDDAGLRAALVAAGNADQVVDATVSREATERRITVNRTAADAQARAATTAQQATAKAQAAAVAERDAVLEEIKRLQRDIILEAFRKGALTAEEATLGLREVGYDVETADLLVTREALRSAGAATP